jgi:hypothetical protein
MFVFAIMLIAGNRPVLRAALPPTAVAALAFRLL